MLPKIARGVDNAWENLREYKLRCTKVEVLLGAWSHEYVQYWAQVTALAQSAFNHWKRLPAEAKVTFNEQQVSQRVHQLNNHQLEGVLRASLLEALPADICKRAMIRMQLSSGTLLFVYMQQQLPSDEMSQTDGRPLAEASQKPAKTFTEGLRTTERVAVLDGDSYSTRRLSRSRAAGGSSERHGVDDVS